MNKNKIIKNMINWAISKLGKTKYIGWVDISRVLKQKDN